MKLLYRALTLFCATSLYSMNELDKFDLRAFTDAEKRILRDAAQHDTQLIAVGRSKKGVLTISRVESDFRICCYRKKQGAHINRLEKLERIAAHQLKKHLEHQMSHYSIVYSPDYENTLAHHQ